MPCPDRCGITGRFRSQRRFVLRHWPSYYVLYLCHAWLDVAEQQTVPSSFIATCGLGQGRITSAKRSIDNRTYVRIDPALSAQRALDRTGSPLLPERSPARSWAGARRCGALPPELWSPSNAHVPSLRHDDLHPTAAHRLRSLLVTPKSLDMRSCHGVATSHPNSPGHSRTPRTHTDDTRAKWKIYTSPY